MNTTEIEGAELAKFGFVHITGLKVRNHNNPDGWIVKANVDRLGTWGTNNDFVVVITERGKVWLSRGFNHGQMDSTPGEFGDLLRRLCPNYHGDMGGMTAFCAIKDCTEQFYTAHLLARIKDPGYEPEPL